MNEMVTEGSWPDRAILVGPASVVILLMESRGTSCPCDDFI